MEILTIFYIIAVIVIIGLIAYYLKQKGKGAGPREISGMPEVPTSEPSEGPEVPPTPPTEGPPEM